MFSYNREISILYHLVAKLHMEEKNKVESFYFDLIFSFLILSEVLN
jgi:heme/copper-type cytochrome/quinol oxidase subunit 4